MADTFLAPRVPLEDGETEELGDKLNGELEAHESGVNLSWKTRGDWDETLFVKLNDVYTHDGKRWLALLASNGVAPGTDDDYWEMIGSPDAAGHLIQNEGSDLAARAKMNFIGDSVNSTDNAGAGATDVTINHLATAVHSAAQPITLQVGGTNVGTHPIIDLIAGGNIILSPTNNTTDGRSEVIITAITGVNTLRSGNGAPSDTAGANLDVYIDLLTGNVYRKETGHWVLKATFAGEQGLPGAAGATFRDGAGAPDDAVGNNGDYWIDTSTWDIYTRAAGTYSVIGNIGAAGYGGTSTTSLTIGTGTKVFTTQAGLAYVLGSRVRATKADDVTKYVEGLVADYDGTSLTITSDATGGSGTVADWVFTIAAGLDDTVVTPGSYTNTSLTVDSKGRITAASNGTASGLDLSTLWLYS